MIINLIRLLQNNAHHFSSANLSHSDCYELSAPFLLNAYSSVNLLVKSAQLPMHNKFLRISTQSDVAIMYLFLPVAALIRSLVFSKFAAAFC